MSLSVVQRRRCRRPTSCRPSSPSGGPRTWRRGVTVGYHSGSHFSTLQALETGAAGRPAQAALHRPALERMAALLERKVPAAATFGLAYYVLEQQGFRKVLDTTFMMGFQVTSDASQDDLERTSARWAVPSRRSTSSPSATSTTSCASCPSSTRCSTRGWPARASGSSSSRTRGRSSSAPTAGSSSAASSTPTEWGRSRDVPYMQAVVV